MAEDRIGERMHMRSAGPQRSLSRPQSGAEKGTRAHEARIITSKEQQRAFRSAERHTRRVRWLKLGLPLIAIGIITGFVSWVAQQQPVVPPEQVVVETETLQQDELIMQSPNLNGFTDGRAYEVVAERAVQKVATPDVINLESLTARITDEEERWVTVTAKSGVFNQAGETMILTGNVDVKSSLGYGLQTDRVDIEMKKSYMQTQSPVEISSGDMQLRADKLEAINNGEQFRFTGKVKIRIDSALLDNANNPLGAERATQ